MTWKKLWLLFTSIWVVVAGLQIFTIVAFSEEPEKVLRPLVLLVAVPAALYAAGLAWQGISKRVRGRGGDRP